MSQRFTTPVDATITVGTAVSHAYPVYIQLLGPSGVDMKYSSIIGAYLSTDTAGDTMASATHSAGFDILTDGTILVEHTADVYQTLKSETDGDIGLTITLQASYTVYLNVILPNGRVITSSALAY
jgi:hypothetical protein